MRKIILIIVGLILAGGIGFMGGIDYQSGKTIPHTEDLSYLMQCMETARDTHQYFVDNPGHYYGQDAFTQEEWVRVYDMTLDILESLR